MKYFKGYYILFLLFIRCNTHLPSEFVLNVHLDGNIDKTEYLILDYHDDQGNYTHDTILLNGTNATFEGKINGSAYASLRSNLGSKSVEDPNHLLFFLEPKKSSIILNQGDFKKAIIKGGTAQQESKQLHSILTEINASQDKLVFLRNELIKKKYSKVISSREIDQELSTIYTQLNSLKKQRIRIENEWIKEHPNSHVSAYKLFTKSNYKEIPMDEIVILYNQLTPSIQKSTYGKRIMKNIDNYKNAIVGSQASDFSRKGYDGVNVNLSSFAGKYILLDFWADWCKPCKADQPKLKELYKQYHSKGLEVIGISYDKSEGRWLNGIKKENLTLWNHILDGKDENGNTIGEIYNVKPIPSYILIDKRGLIFGRYAAADAKKQYELEDLEQDLKEIFAIN